MRILIHNVAGGYGGSEKTIEMLLPHLCLKASISVAGQNKIFLSNLSTLASQSNFKIYEFPNGRSPWQLIRGIFETIAICRSEKFDHIIANSNKSAFIIALSRIFFPKKTMISVFIRDFQWERPKLTFFLLGKETKYLVPSMAVSDLWPKRYGNLKKPSIIPSPFDDNASVLHIVPDCNDSASNETTITDKKNFLVLGTINAWKGIDTVISAFAIVTKHSPDARLEIAGQVADETIFQKLSEQIQALNLESVIHFSGHVRDVEPVIRRNRILISASVPWNGGPETFGRTIIEAWAYLRPVIASRCGGPIYLIRENIDGLLFTPGDPDDLARAMIRYLDDPVYMWETAINGRLRFVSEFSSVNVATRLLSTLQRTQS